MYPMFISMIKSNICSPMVDWVFYSIFQIGRAHAELRHLGISYAVFCLKKKSLALSIVLFTLILTVSTVLTYLSPDILNYSSGGLSRALGLVAILPEIWEIFLIKRNPQALTLFPLRRIFR